jgi:hypothetical protein
MDILATTLARAYQWYRNGTPIPSAVNQFLIVTESGQYQVRITNQEGCTAMSDPFEVTVLGVEAISTPSAAAELHVYPEPANNILHIALRSKEAGPLKVIISDLTGRYDVIHEGMMSPHAMDFTVPLQNRARGVYYVIVLLRDIVLTQRVTKM